MLIRFNKSFDGNDVNKQNTHIHTHQTLRAVSLERVSLDENKLYAPFFKTTPFYQHLAFSGKNLNPPFSGNF